MYSKTAKQLIQYWADAGYHCYAELKPEVQRQIVNAILKEEKPCITDLECDDVFLELFANIILSNGDFKSLQQLSCKLNDIFVRGTAKKEAHYAAYIDETFAECIEREDKQFDDLIIADNQERLRDMQIELKNNSIQQIC